MHTFLHIPHPTIFFISHLTASSQLLARVICSMLTTPDHSSYLPFNKCVLGFKPKHKGNISCSPCVHMGLFQILWFPPTFQKHICAWMDLWYLCVCVCVCMHDAPFRLFPTLYTNMFLYTLT